MKKHLVVILLLAILAMPVLSLEWRWAPDPDFRSPDKFSHILSGNYLTAEFSQWRFAHNNRWIGFASMSGVMDIGWEGKDAVMPYEKWGRFGAEGYDWGDVLMNTAGGLYGVRLHSQILVWLKIKDEIKYPEVRGKYQRPLAELWPILGRRVSMAGFYVAGCVAYNYSVYGEPFPHRDSFYRNPKGAGFLQTLNSESSFIIPWLINSELRPYLPLNYRYVAMNLSYYIFEEVNGLWDDRDVPWFGDREGFKEGDLWTGFISANLAFFYDLIAWPKEVEREIQTTVGPTPDGGFGLMRLEEKSAWFISVVMPRAGGTGINFQINF